MKTFEFAIIASGLDPRADDFEARFHDAGCDDATVSFQKGHIIIDFAREASGLGEAIASAIEDVTTAGARVERVEPDPLVSLSEIAVRTGLTRAAISHYARGQRGKGFPPPVARVTSESPLWKWSDVTGWLHRRGKIGEEAVAEAEALDAANVAISGAPTVLSGRSPAHGKKLGPPGA